MLTIISSIIGLVSGIGPGILKSWIDFKQDKSDKAHELAMLTQQSQNRLDQAVVEGTSAANVAVQKTAREGIKGASQWVINIAALVRPVIAYAFFIEFFTLSMLAAFGVISEGQFSEIWSVETAATFAGIINFYYGQRLSQHLWKR